MAISDVFKINQIKLERDQAIYARDQLLYERDQLLQQAAQLRYERDQSSQDAALLRSTLAETDHMQFYQLKQAIAELTAQRESIRQSVNVTAYEINQAKEQLHLSFVAYDRDMQQKRATIQADLDGLHKQIEQRRSELVVLEDELLLQSFGLYTPRYDLSNSEAYKQRIEQVRREQAAKVKQGLAAHCPTNWTVNNSLKEGQKMIKDYTKLIIRSFNNECDSTIINVKFNNIDSLEKKIRKAFETLNKLAVTMNILLTNEYLNSKLEELYLCYEYQLKKQREKEEQRALREQLREEAKLLREMEEIKIKLAKEERHFIKALESIESQLLKVNNEAEKNLLEQEKIAISQQLVKLEHEKQDVINREHNTRAGYVYIISNIGAFGENIYKIGVTRRLDPQDRIDELGDASVPFEFDVHALIFSDDAPALENALHRAFEARRLNMINRRREFFHVTLKEIEHVVKNHFSKPVEFAELADAAEYRQSLILRKG
ncbi:DUF4041 domain-containing protein [Herpetosiphon llansteffanensis]|uniref:DUF4041 domain-containing protein n=1 Tax=Herpetosiphon llansteffanensis TaxID=2094568 RepID=UPI000D7CCA58|nr:DUF4041 domain-containing protein [Herpetosiphon llansteffanensis]